MPVWRGCCTWWLNSDVTGKLLFAGTLAESKSQTAAGLNKPRSVRKNSSALLNSLFFETAMKDNIYLSSVSDLIQ